MGQQQGEGGAEGGYEDAESCPSWNLKEALFDGDGEDMSDLDWDQVERYAAEELAKGDPVDDQQPVAPPPQPGPEARPGRLRRKRRPAREQLHRPAPRPTKMSHAELDEHRREGHVNFHPGCEHCVAARALADRHERADDPEQDPAGSEGRLPTIGMDFCYLGSETDPDQLAVLVMQDSATGSVMPQA